MYINDDEKTGFPMPELNFPGFRFKVRKDGHSLKIWDGIRKIWLPLTPEEWVRQHFLRVLTEQEGVPSTLIKQECPVCVNSMAQRADVVVYGRDGRPVLLAECKAPHTLDRTAYAQAVRYNSVIGARYICVTDGIGHFFYGKTGDGGYAALKEFPPLDL